MKMYKILSIAFLLLGVIKASNAREENVLTSTVLDKQIAVLDKEKQEVARKTLTPELEVLAAEQRTLKSKQVMAVGENAEFLKRTLSLVVQDDHIVRELEHMYQQQRSILDEHIKVLQGYRDDPEFKKLSVAIKSAYTFDEFEDLGGRVLAVSARLAELEKMKPGVYDDLAKLKKALGAVEEEYQEKSKIQAGFSGASELPEGLSRELAGKLVDIQKRLLTDKKLLAESKVKEAEMRIALLDTQILFTRAQLTVLKEQYERVKHALYVESAYVRKAETELEHKRHESSLVRDKLREEIKVLSARQDEVRKRADEVYEKYGISRVAPEWEKTPRTVREWLILCSMEDFIIEGAVFDLERELKEAAIEFEKAKIRKDEVYFSIIRSWHALTGRRLSLSSRLFDQQIKDFATLKAEIQGDLALLVEKRVRTINALSDLNTQLERIKSLSQLLHEQKNTIFKDAAEEYGVCVEHVHTAEELIRQRLYLTAKLIESYSAVIVSLEGTIKRIETVVIELDTSSFWRRSAQSISWDELRNFSPDLQRFFQDVIVGVSAYWQQVQLLHVVEWLRGYTSFPLILLLLLRILMLMLVFWIARTYLPDVRLMLVHGHSRSRVRLFLAMMLSFVERHLITLYAWLVIYLLIVHEFIGHVYFALLFYFVSIPYMLFLATAFLEDFSAVNAQLPVPFVAPSYKPRLVLVLRIFLFSTIVLFFLREAFLMGNYHASAVPTILLALNYIILQLSLMSLVSKEWIVGLIPRNTPLWEWVYEHVAEYYYLFWAVLMAVIVMSNPYVGYGRQVLYVLTRVALLGLLIPMLSFAYSWLRTASSDLFFYYAEGDSVRERFVSARTWYGVFIIVTFFFLIFMGGMVALYFLGYSIGLSDIGRFLRYEIYSPGVDELGRRLSVTPFVLMRVFMVIIGGFVATYVVNNFILRRIFDPLMVTSGIQNTIFTLSRYIIIFLALLIGLKSVGLESFATKLMFILGAVGFIIKEPILDFLSYFILLVQRPIKIGDFITLDDNVNGVVRHITPRSVIIRRKNSVTLVVPNSQFITRPIANWNYTRSFFALNDIFLTVPYTADPDTVKKTILQVLDENPLILKSPAPCVFLNDFIDNGYQFMIRPFLTSDKVLDQWEISSEVRLSLVRTLRSQGIAVASPTRTVHVISPGALPGT